MSRLRRRRIKSEEDTEVDMVPIMNMFLVLIPFLLMSASFYHLKVINTSVPVLSSSSGDSSGKSAIKITAIVELKKNENYISAISNELPQQELEKWENQLVKKNKAEYPFEQMVICLQKIKDKYPKSDTLIIIPEESVIYDTIILAMDTARYSNNKLPLFPNVVLSGKVG